MTQIRPVVAHQEAQAPPRSNSEAEASAQLVRGVMMGEASAIAQLWNEYSPLVRRILYRGLGRDGEVEDRLQEVFLRIYRSMSTLRDPVALKGFIITVSAREIASEIRRRKVRRWLRLTPTGVVPEPSSEDNVDASETSDVLRRMHAILDEIDPKDRLAFVLRHVEELELSGVARSLGVSLATAKRRIARAATHVQGRLREDDALSSHLGLTGLPESSETGS